MVSLQCKDMIETSLIKWSITWMGFLPKHVTEPDHDETLGKPKFLYILQNDYEQEGEEIIEIKAGNNEPRRLL